MSIFFILIFFILFFVRYVWSVYFFFFQAEDGIRDHCVTGVQTCALPISDRCTDLPSVLERPDDIRAHVTLHAPASHRKDEHHVLGRQAACLQPVSEDGFPTIVVDTRRKLGDVVRGRIRLDPGNLAEIINRVRRMPGAASYAEDEQAPAEALGLSLLECFPDPVAKLLCMMKVLYDGRVASLRVPFLVAEDVTATPDDSSVEKQDVATELFDRRGCDVQAAHLDPAAALDLET